MVKMSSNIRILLLICEIHVLFIRFHIRHGNAEVASSTDESDVDEEEEFTHSRNELDANLHGTSYAKWKREMLKDMGEDENEYDDDINEVDF